MRAKRVRTVGLRALQVCALFLAGACGASFIKSARVAEKTFPGQSPAAVFQDGQQDVSSTVLAGATFGAHHRELHRAAQKVALQARNETRAFVDALHAAMIRGQAEAVGASINKNLGARQSSQGKSQKSSKHSQRKHAKAKKQDAQVRGTHLDVPLEELGLSPQAVIELRAKNEQERQARLAEVRAQFYKRRPGLSDAEPGSLRGDHMVQEEVATARDAELFKLFSKKHGLSYMRRQQHAKRPETLRLEETAVGREARTLIQTVEADATRCAKLSDRRSVRVVVAGMSESGRLWLLTAVRALLGAAYGEEELAESRKDGSVAVNGTRALEILSKSPYAIVAVEEFDAKLLAAADYVFLTHQDPRSEFAERAQKGDGKRAPTLHRAFQEHGRWLQHACADSAHERAAGDALGEISRLTTLLCLPGIDPGEIAGVIQEELDRSGYESPVTTGSSDDVSYRKVVLPGEITERVEQAFGTWMALHGYRVKNQAGQAGLIGASELLSGTVLRVQNCPRRPEAVSL
ncbi:hypothetical protein KFL_001540260 [Klebsormidium nitens]|uniref:Uncharacterized protein n=1 Tax=Klebsormidium nitens TaxID=105231 RepID=A0A1Y1I677_KLENI|nr:hypothetical protein KFL_001540260 [Klebsormidium nitens]|eukprot:GAQ83608.1 hypothetical protein KFL_001540260 [Klebsormidium nitens]